MKTIGLWIVGGIVALFAVAAFTAFSLGVGRIAAPIAEETRRLTFEQSRAHQSGVNSAISDYCLNMRTATDKAQKAALARFVINEASTFRGPLTADAQACLSEAQSSL